MTSDNTGKYEPTWANISSRNLKSMNFSQEWRGSIMAVGRIGKRIFIVLRKLEKHIQVKIRKSNFREKILFFARVIHSGNLFPEE
ncbi:MAG: hypothetical protein ACEY3F_02295, partial [Wolbachia sp.]